MVQYLQTPENGKITIAVLSRVVVSGNWYIISVSYDMHWITVQIESLPVLFDGNTVSNFCHLAIVSQTVEPDLAVIILRMIKTNSLLIQRCLHSHTKVTHCVDPFARFQAMQFFRFQGRRGRTPNEEVQKSCLCQYFFVKQEISLKLLFLQVFF
ncbi:hypothetical protein K501DRAFT_268445 [Backusella circina FSU 941]|nr:hypothetical protein K501DRAFT_268445 [Backusella circina FSU 941]